jgi:hypothetical protein
MALVASVQTRTVTLSAGTATNTAELDVGTDTSYCVPFFTHRVTTAAGVVDALAHYLPDIWFTNPGGTPTVNVQTTESATRVLEVYITVVQFESAEVDVHSGTFQLTDTTISTNASIGDTVTDTDCFPVIAWRCGPVNVDDNSSSTVSAKFNGTGSVTQLTVERHATGQADGQIDGHFYVVESINGGFTTQHRTITLTFANTSADSTDLTAVTGSSTMTIGTMRMDGGADDVNAFAYLHLVEAASDYLQLKRTAAPAFGAASLVCEAFAVEFAGSENVNRVVRAQTAQDAEEDVTITTLTEYTESMAHTPATTSWFNMWINHGSTGTGADPYATLKLTSNTNMRINHLIDGTQTGTAEISYEVIEWEVTAAGATRRVMVIS